MKIPAAGRQPTEQRRQILDMPGDEVGVDSFLVQ
jgi:hypothetical protein